ncbi:MAG: metallophosphoesterase [Vicinamibacterales bacterium]
MPFSVLHISDLHRSPSDPISNEELLSALVSDRDRYTREDPPIPAPEAIVVSGDIIQGVRLGVPDSDAALNEQYAVAFSFLDELVRRFLGGDRSRVVIVPGNHDVDWNTARAAMTPVDEANMPSNLEDALFRASSDFRWDWRTRQLFRITNPSLYERRLGAFWRFFQSFYDGVPGLLDVRAGADANLFSLCDDRIGLAGFNSCHGNDCFDRRGMIRKEAVARSHLELNDTGTPFDLRVAVWHHSIDGPPHRTDYMDVDLVRGMIGRGFRLGLYGHQHRTQVAPHQVSLPDRERMAVVSAGSLCAGSRDLPTGTYRQYNILELAPDFLSVRVHVREMSVANLFSRGTLVDFGGTSVATLDWDAPRNPVGGVVDYALRRRRAAIQDAEGFFKGGQPARAVALLRPLDLPPSSYERELFLNAAMASEDWPAVIAVTEPPRSIDELVRRVDACIRHRDFSTARAALASYSHALAMPTALTAELLRRIDAMQGLRR